MSWIPGGSVVFSVSNTAQQLTTSTSPITAIRFRTFWQNANVVYWGDSTLNPVNVSGGSPAPLGIIGYQNPLPLIGLDSEYEELDLGFSGFGVNPSTFYVCGQEGEQIIWEYKS